MVDDEDVWNDTFQSLQSTDTLVLGRVMYPAYEQYWLNHAEVSRLETVRIGPEAHEVAQMRR